MAFLNIAGALLDPNSVGKCARARHVWPGGADSAFAPASDNSATDRRQLPYLGRSVHRSTGERPACSRPHEPHDLLWTPALTQTPAFTQIIRLLPFAGFVGLLASNDAYAGALSLFRAITISAVIAPNFSRDRAGAASRPQSGIVVAGSVVGIPSTLHFGR